MAPAQTIELGIAGMDCADCARHVQEAIAGTPGVESVDVLLAAEKAVIRLDPATVELATIRRAVIQAGYTPRESPAAWPTIEHSAAIPFAPQFTRRILTFFALVFGAVLLVVVIGEWMGLIEQLTARIPFVIGLALVLLSGWPILRNVARAALKRQITAHTLMTFGMLAALAIGEWATAAVVVFFMRVGDYAENFTTESARRAVKDLTSMAPQTARVEQDGSEQEIPVVQVTVGATVVVRPGEKIPVDGEVLSGHATVDQATITGESMPVEIGAGDSVFAATVAQLGSLRIRATRVGPDTTFGRVIKLVEEAELHRADVQRLADKFSGYYLPIVLGVAALTFLFSRNPLATAAVLLVACSCSFALATPIAVLASVGAGAKRGLLIKGGKHLEALAQADVLLIDKTGTLTLGRPEITDIVPFNGLNPDALLALAASAERDSEHPLGQAVRAAAYRRQLPLAQPEDFSAQPGMGVKARINGHRVAVGNQRFIPQAALLFQTPSIVTTLQQEGKTLLFVAQDDEVVGVLTATDTLRPEVPTALDEVRALGVRHMELLTGDNEATAAALAHRLNVRYQANLLPEDKIAVVKRFQAQGHTVVMVGDGVNDAPALAQADIGIAMGAAGSDIALEAAHIALMRDDWLLVPEVFRIARRTMNVVRLNLGFTALYNLVGLTLAAFGFLPPIVAAAAQSVPDLGILANSVRLLRVKSTPRPSPPP